MGINNSKLADTIRNNNVFLLTTHVNPDADAIGSQLVIARALKRLGKRCKIINHDKTPDNLEFLTKPGEIELYNSDEHDEYILNCDVLAAVDFNQYNRMVSMEKVFSGASGKKICIDHHRNPDPIFDEIYVDIEYSSTGEIIYDFLSESGLSEINFEVAEPLYAAIVTDTGSFRFERTTAHTHLIAAELLKAGVDPTQTYDKLYNRGSINKISLLGEALESVKIAGNGMIAYMAITRELFERTGTVRADLEGFVNYCMMIDGVVIGMMATELDDGVKVSFRSKGKFSANKLAAEFDGGGHFNAAGAKFDGMTIPEVIKTVVSAAEKYISEEE